MTISFRPNPISKGPGGRERITRLSAIALIIYGRGRATGEELATKLAVNLRTVYRDITRLQQLGFPIISTPGPGGGFTFDHDSAAETSVSTKQDLLDLFTRTGLLTSDTATLETIIGLASDSLDNRDLQKLQKASERIIFDPEEWYTRDRPSPDFALIRNAVIHDHRLRISFTERTGAEIIEDTFEPYGLIWKGGFWYAYGNSHQEQRYRRIRIQRLIHVIDTGEVFMRPEKFDLIKHWRDELEDFGKGKTRVVLRIDQPAIHEFENFNWKRENKIAKAKDHWIVDMEVDRFEWLIPLVLSYAGEVRVLTPTELRNKIIAASKAVLNVHSGYDQNSRTSYRQPDDTRSRAATHRGGNQE